MRLRVIPYKSLLHSRLGPARAMVQQQILLGTEKLSVGNEKVLDSELYVAPEILTRNMRLQHHDSKMNSGDLINKKRNLNDKH